jgi:hypothetical protein
MAEAIKSCIILGFSNIFSLFPTTSSNKSFVNLMELVNQDKNTDLENLRSDWFNVYSDITLSFNKMKSEVKLHEAK